MNFVELSVNKMFAIGITLSFRFFWFQFPAFLGGEYLRNMLSFNGA
jgi:hypothetical protein